MLNNLSGLADIAFNIVIIILGVIFLLAIGGAIYYMFWYKYKRYKDYVVYVMHKDAFGNIQGYKDDAAVFLKGNNKRLWLRLSDISLPADNIPYIKIGGEKMVFLLKKGTKNFLFVTPKVNDEGITFKVGEEDINWALIVFDHSSKSFSQSVLLQYMPYMIVVFSLLIVMVIAFMLIKKFDIIVEAANSLAGGLSRNIV